MKKKCWKLIKRCLRLKIIKWKVETALFSRKLWRLTVWTRLIMHSNVTSLLLTRIQGRRSRGGTCPPLSKVCFCPPPDFLRKQIKFLEKYRKRPLCFFFAFQNISESLSPPSTYNSFQKVSPLLGSFLCHWYTCTQGCG